MTARGLNALLVMGLSEVPGAHVAGEEAVGGSEAGQRAVGAGTGVEPQLPMLNPWKERVLCSWVLEMSRPCW